MAYAVEMPVAWTFQRPWEDYFTVVQWDQRGAGRSYPLNDPKTLGPTLRPERYRDDAIELIEQLCKRYGKRKVFVVGHSWGSAIGLMVAQKRPDLLYAYIGMGQLIDARARFRRNGQARRRYASRWRSSPLVGEVGRGVAPPPPIFCHSVDFR